MNKQEFPVSNASDEDDTAKSEHYRSIGKKGGETVKQLRPKAKSTHAELNRMIDAFEAMRDPSLPIEIRPVYDDTYTVYLFAVLPHNVIKYIYGQLPANKACTGRLGLHAFLKPSSELRRFPFPSLFLPSRR